MAAAYNLFEWNSIALKAKLTHSTEDQTWTTSS